MKKSWQAMIVGVAVLAGAGWIGAKEMAKDASKDMPMDPLKVAPDMYSLVFENERVRVMQVVFKPGQEIKKHSHPDHYVYVLEAGQLTISKPDGSSGVVDLTPGQVLWIPAETHWAKNTGMTQVKLLVNELKAAKK